MINVVNELCQALGIRLQRLMQLLHFFLFRFMHVSARPLVRATLPPPYLDVLLQKR